jgi:hypothetical protein
MSFSRLADAWMRASRSRCRIQSLITRSTADVCPCIYLHLQSCGYRKATRACSRYWVLGALDNGPKCREPLWTPADETRHDLLVTLTTVLAAARDFEITLHCARNVNFRALVAACLEDGFPGASVSLEQRNAIEPVAHA